VFVEKKILKNSEKVSFVKAFPGRLKDWEAAVGKHIRDVVKLEKGAAGLVIFSDASFLPVSCSGQEPGLLLRLLLAAQPLLAPHYPGAYARLAQLIAEDKEMQRMARLENIMGAIKNNLPQIPELREALKDFLAAQAEAPKTPPP